MKTQLKCLMCQNLFDTQEIFNRHSRKKHNSQARWVAVDKRDGSKIEDENSFAQHAIDAELDRAMWVNNPDIDWLLP